jgi:hypothetical protein
VRTGFVLYWECKGNYFCITVEVVRARYWREYDLVLYYLEMYLLILSGMNLYMSEISCACILSKDSDIIEYQWG